jgi:NAD(P)H-hydrate epimerase
LANDDVPLETTMKRAVTAEQMAQLDRAAGEKHGIPVSTLMENAGTALAAQALQLSTPDSRFLVVCGTGNNGGDGIVAAGKLAGQGRLVRLEVIGGPEKLSGEPLRKWREVEAAPVAAGPIPPEVPIARGDLVIDAVFGTGLNRAPKGAHAEAIRKINAWRVAGATVLAADLPSGLHSDSGQPFDPCVSADATVAFGFLKVGQVLEPGATLSGAIQVAEIGLPKEEIHGPAIFLLEEEDARSRLPPRQPDSHKGTYGHLLVVAGSWGKMGAAALSGIGALRAGVGLASVATRPDAMATILSHAPELMGIPLEGRGGLGMGDLPLLLEAGERKQAMVFGPGIPVGPETSKLLAALVHQLSIPCLLDADGLNAVAGNLPALSTATVPLLLTPHPGEMSRLLGQPTAEVQRDRIGAVRALAGAARCVSLLKGARTLIGLPDGTVFVNATGNPGMATAGVGDVLSGICGALLAQRLTPADAAVVGVFAHGLAGDLVSARTGMAGLVASDLFEGLQQVWVRWGR